MGRLVVALDARAGVSPEELAEAWNGDDEARAVGEAGLEFPAPGEYLADVLALVVIPLLVNLGSSAAYDLVRRPATEADLAQPEAPALEIVQLDRANGDRILVVRQRRNTP
jgi:hypothetical protein